MTANMGYEDMNGPQFLPITPGSVPTAFEEEGFNYEVCVLPPFCDQCLRPFEDGASLS